MFGVLNGEQVKKSEEKKSEEKKSEEKSKSEEKVTWWDESKLSKRSREPIHDQYGGDS